MYVNVCHVTLTTVLDLETSTSGFIFSSLTKKSFFFRKNDFFEKTKKPFFFVNELNINPEVEVSKSKTVFRVT